MPEVGCGTAAPQLAAGLMQHVGAATPTAPQPPLVPTALLWLRRDLRVSDNPALVASLQGAVKVVPVYIWAPEEEGQFQPGRCSRWWLCNSLETLDADLKALGSRIVYRSAPESRTALLQLVQETGATALFFNHLYDPISMVRDNEVKTAMSACGVTCHTFNSDVLYEPWELLSPSGQPLVNFNDYWNRVNSMPYAPPLPLPVPGSMPELDASVVGLDLSGMGLMSSEEENSCQQLKFTWQPGGRGAHLVLQEFVLQRLVHFSGNRAKTDVRSTSRLSPHMHNGEISTRHIYYVVKQREATFLHMEEAEAVRNSCGDFLRQMGYREYSRYLSFHFPFTHERPLLQHLRACPWRLDQGAFKAWRQGRTGYPLVDAGLRELWSTGWMHNRMRVVCASFLVKNLLLPWQWGLKHYWDAQLDADLECAALGWQYCSGCLADAHPFSCMLDQHKESQRFDPSGNYVRRWLPVLSRLPNTWIHRPHEAPSQVLQDAGVELGANYDWPIISTQESKHHVAHACGVMDRCLAVPAGSDGTACGEPYRVPTAPGFDATTLQGEADPHEESGAPAEPQFYSSDEEVLSNVVAGTQQQPSMGGGGTSQAISGAVSQAPRRRQREPDDDTQTVNGALAPATARPQPSVMPAPGGGAQAGGGDAVVPTAVPPQAAGNMLAADKQPGRSESVSPGKVTLPRQVEGLVPAPVDGARIPAAGATDTTASGMAGVKVGTASVGDAAAEKAAPSTVRAGGPARCEPKSDGYPASWTDAEVRAHLQGDMERLSSLQEERMRQERVMADSRSGRTDHTCSHLPGAQEAASAKPRRQPKPQADVGPAIGWATSDPPVITGASGRPLPTKRKRVLQ